MQTSIFFDPDIESGFLGYANIENKVVDKAVSYLKSIPVKYLLNLNENKGKNPNGEYITFNYLADFKEITFKNEKRFYIGLVYKISKLDSSIPIENLLIKISQKVNSLGIISDAAEVRFEKGCFKDQFYWEVPEKVQDYWHKDRAGLVDDNITISYSNILTWCTKIFDNSFTPSEEIVFKENKKLYCEMEKHSVHSTLGFLYNVDNIFHRSPLKSDFFSNPLENDYRLFIKFYKINFVKQPLSNDNSRCDISVDFTLDLNHSKH